MSTTDEVELGGRWEMLPDAALENILARLPVAAQCRLRCVSSKWKELLSLPFSPSCLTKQRPSCTVLVPRCNSNTRFFCHAESKWFPLPRIELALPSWKEGSMSVADAEGGFFCWQHFDRFNLTLAVSNPLGHAVQILPQKPQLDGNMFGDGYVSGFAIVKLWVDWQTKTFKVFLLGDDPAVTGIFDSSTFQWDVFDSHPCNFEVGLFELGRFEFFFWKRVLHVYNSHEQEYGDLYLLYGDTYDGPFMPALDTELRTWKKTEAEFPGMVCWPMQYRIVNRKEEVMLVQVCLPGADFVSVWKLMDNAPKNPNPDFSLSRWEKIALASDPSMNLARSPLIHVFYGEEYMYFVLKGDNRPEHLADPALVKYTFATETWSLFPFPRAVEYANNGYWLRGKFDWEPSLYEEVKLNVPNNGRRG